MQELSIRFHSEEKIGDAIFRMFQDSAAIPNVIDGLIVQPLIFFPAAIGALLYLLWYDTRMALIVALLMPANLILAWMYANSLRTAFIAERETTARATTRIEETLASIKTVKAFGTEAREAENYARENWDAFLAGRRARLMLARYRVVTNTVRGLAYVAALYIGAREVMAGGPRVSAASSFRSDCSRDRSILFPTSAIAREISPTSGAACRTWSSRSRACSR